MSEPKFTTVPHSFFPPAKNYSVSNQYYKHQMSSRALAALGRENSTSAFTTTKKSRIGRSKPRAANGIKTVARMRRHCNKKLDKTHYHGRQISIGGWGPKGRGRGECCGASPAWKPPSAQAAGTMDRLARLKAKAIGHSKEFKSI